MKPASCLKLCCRQLVLVSAVALFGCGGRAFESRGQSPSAPGSDGGKDQVFGSGEGGSPALGKSRGKYDDCVEPDADGGFGATGTLSTLVPGQINPREIVVDSNTIYWVNNSNSLMKASISGGEPITIATMWFDVLHTAKIYILSIAVDAKSIYFTGYGVSEADGTIWKMPLEGGTPVVLASKQYAPSGVAVDQTNVYWTNSGYTVEGPQDVPPRPEPGSVWSAAIEGGDPVELAGDQRYPGAVAVQNSRVYWADGNMLFGEGSHSIMSVSTQGGAPAAVVSDQSDPGSIALDSTHLYWTNSNSISRVALGGGVPATVVSGNTIANFAVDLANVYWIDLMIAGASVSGTLNRAALDGSAQAVLTSHVYPFTLAVDCSSIYWATNDSIVKLTPKYASTFIDETSAPLDGGLDAPDSDGRSP